MMNAKQNDIAVIVLAAGKGTRMKSARSKVLHSVCGLPLLEYSLRVAEAMRPKKLVVVVGRDADAVKTQFANRAEFVLQAEQRGTGHAVLQCREALRDFCGDVLILYGDTPLLRSETLEQMVLRKRATQAHLVLLTAPVPLPGRIVRDTQSRVMRIVEVTDATPEELAIQEGNTGVYLVEAALLWKALDQLDDSNKQGELYLTDIVKHAIAMQCGVEAVCLGDAQQALGVNQRVELAQAAAALRARKLEELMLSGVTIVDPATTYIDTDVCVGRDTLIEPGCVLTGASRVGEGVHLKASSYIEDSSIGDRVVIGPMAHLRPGTRLDDEVRIGNFVEVKNSHLGRGAKADHLSYIGDAEVGERAAFGCGAITVNYNWVEKNKTIVEEDAVVGCNANLIAPVKIGKGASVAAGATIVEDVPDDALAIARAEQRHLAGWSKRNRKRKE